MGLLLRKPELQVAVFEFKEDADREETLLTATARLPSDVNEKGECREGANAATLLTGTNNERLEAAMMNCRTNRKFTQELNTNELVEDDGVVEWQR